MLHQGLGIRLWLIQQMDTSRRHFTQIMRWNIRSHPHCNPGDPIQQHMG